MSEQPPAAPTSTHSGPPVAAATKTYIFGTGRRKTAVARVRIRPGNGQFTVNRRPLKEYFPLENQRIVCMAPLKATDTVNKLDVFVNVNGGGSSGQAGAVSLGIARSLVRYDAVHEPTLRDGQFLTRDSRKVERKKPGQPGARKRFQFSKR